MLPFTEDQFFAVFAAYNEAVWPVPVLAYGLALVVVFLAARASASGGHVAGQILAAMWIWTGIAYHGLYFRPINPAAAAFGAGFVLQGVLFLVYGPVLGRLRFATADPVRRWAGFGLIVYAMVLYPLLGLAAGHAYPAAPTFGITPCPLTIFTFGLFLVAVKVPRPLLIVPLIWSVIGGSAAVLLNVQADWMLPVGAILTLVLLLRGKPRIHRTA